MTSNPPTPILLPPPPQPLADHRGKWMALIAALLGWMFDGFEIGMFPLVGPKALDELLAVEIAANPAVKDQWFGVIIAVFLVGAATGGVLFGWLGDRMGRVWAMSLSILTYAIFTGLCGFATEAWHLAVLRFIASLGMGGEWALGVALVTEIWPDKSRAFLAGLIGAAANVGFLLVGLLSLGLLSVLDSTRSVMQSIGMSEETTQTMLRGDGWRLLMMAGALPALLVFFIFLCVPESKRWIAEKAKGSTSHWATRDLLGVLVGSLGAMLVVYLWSPLMTLEPGTPTTVLKIVGTLAGIAVALGGFIYPVMRYMTRAAVAGAISNEARRTTLFRMLFGAALAGVALLGTWGSVQWVVKWAIALDKYAVTQGGVAHAHVKEYTQISTAVGAIIGTILAALVAGWLGRRITYAMLCVASLGAVIYLYQFVEGYGPEFLFAVALANGVTAAFYGWFPLYFPELFRTSVRATAQGFAYNFGRVLAAIGSLQAATLIAYFSRDIPKELAEVQGFPKAGTVLCSIYLLGAVLIWFGPETKGKPLPE